MTFTTPYVTIDGIPSAIPTQLEYTNRPMASAYFNAITAFVNVLNIQPSANQPFPALAITTANVNQVNAALFQLTKLAKYGVIATSSGQVIFPDSVVSAGFLAAHNLSPQFPPSAGKSSYHLYLMTMSMAQDYDAILRSLAAIGVNVNAAGANFPQVSALQLMQWRDLAVQVSAIARVVQAAELEGFGGAQSLQGLIETDYVQAGNDIISKNMAQLNSALHITQQILSSLAQLQSIHNQVTTKASTFLNPNGTGPFDYTVDYGATGPSGWAGIYQHAASAFFNKPVTPVIISTVAPGHPGFPNAYKQLVSVRATLSAQLKLLSANTPTSALANSTSLYQTVKKVLSDLNTAFTTPTGTPIFSTTPSGAASAGFKKWMLDNYSAFNNPTANQAGQFQQNITFAITAGENLNDTQKETVRNFLFIFEEYYQSAAAALQAITQIIQKMAQHIST